MILPRGDHGLDFDGHHRAQRPRDSEDVRKQEFVQTLHAYGLPQRRIFLHVAKNASPTVLAIIGIQLGHLIGGSVLVETVFAWPGAGYLLHEAIMTRDLPLLQAQCSSWRPSSFW